MNALQDYFSISYIPCNVSNIYLYSKYKPVVLFVFLFLGFPSVSDMINECGLLPTFYGYIL